MTHSRIPIPQIFDNEDTDSLAGGLLDWEVDEEAEVTEEAQIICSLGLFQSPEQSLP